MLQSRSLRILDTARCSPRDISITIILLLSYDITNAHTCYFLVMEYVRNIGFNYSFSCLNDSVICKKSIYSYNRFFLVLNFLHSIQLIIMKQKCVIMTSIRNFSVSKKSLFVSRVHLFAFLIVCVTLSSLFVGGATAATYSGSCGDDLTWTLDTDTGVLEIEGTGEMTDYSAINGMGWQNYRDTITSVSIGSGVTSIGHNAFYNCSALTSVVIPDNVTSIASYAFYNCISLTSVVIPDNVTSIGQRAFSGCSSLTSVTIGNGVTSIGDCAFYNCISLTSVVIPDNVTSIGDWAFWDCISLTSVTIGNSVTSIGRRAFDDCTSLTSVVIPDRVTSIGEGTFEGCSSLTSIEISDSVTSIGNCAFYYCTSLTSVVIPDNVTSIGDAAFAGCSLTSIEIPDNVTSIGGGAFMECSSLTSIVIPDCVTSIEHSAFRNCSSLTSVTIGNSVTSIGHNAFYNCTALTSVVIPDSVTSIGDWAFRDCISLTSVVITDNVTSIGDVAFAGCISLTSVFIPDSVTSIENIVFYDCNALTSVVIPDNVTSIGDYAFYGCSNLTSIDLPDNVTSIGVYTFYGCNSLTSVVIPDNVTSIGWGAFYGCSNLTSIDLPDSVTSIDRYAFAVCSLTSIVLPSHLTYLGTGAFSGCSSLTSAVFSSDLRSLGNSAFSGCSSLTLIEIPAGVTSIGQSAFSYCTNLEVVDLSGTTALSSVGDHAFGYSSDSALKSGSVIYVCDERTAALFIAGTNYYAPNTRIIVGKPTQEITYIIQFDANGGTGSMSNQTFTYNTTQNLSSNTFVKNASVFSGWATTADGPVVYTDGQSVRNLLNSNNSTLILYAVWTPDENPITPDSSLPLTTGWNFISVPKTLNASNNTAGSLFGSVGTRDKNILGYNTQTGTWVPLAIADVIQPLNGYWIYAAAETAINLTYPSTPTLPSVKTLYPGWNAVGLSSGENTTADNALACLGSSWKTVIPWNLADGSYDTVIINGGSGANGPDRLMTLGNGYWLYVDAQSTLTGLTA